MHASGVVDDATLSLLRQRFVSQADTANQRSAALTHTTLLQPQDDPVLAGLMTRITPQIEAFGELLFGERLDWTVKELWLNRLETGGHQGLHNHANSLVSAVLYLTPVHASAATVFVKAMGHAGYVFSNAHAGAATNPFNADKWVMPAVAAGDMVLFPSHLLHEVPVNQGGQRLTLAMNAIPSRLNAFGYRIGLQP
jgi:uncharacterized protein (TIGR02466 family)